MRARGGGQRHVATVNGKSDTYGPLVLMVMTELRDKIDSLEYALQFDSAHKVLLLTFGKTVTKASLGAAYDDLEHLIAAEGPCRGIVDFSAVAQAEISADSVRSISRRPPA